MGKPHSADLSHLRITFPPEGAQDRTQRIANSSLQEVVFGFPVFPWIPEQLSPPNPAAAADLIVTVPGAQQWRLLYARIALVTDVNAANRFLQLNIRRADNTVIVTLGSNGAQVASTTNVYNYFPGANRDAAINLFRNVPVPNNSLLLPDWNLHWFVSGVQVGDQLSGQLFVERRQDFAG